MSVSLSHPPSISAIDPGCSDPLSEPAGACPGAYFAADEPYSAVWWAIARLGLRANCKDRLMSLRIVPRKKSSGMLATIVTAAVALAPLASASAQQGKGPPILRDAETEALLRE